VKKNNIQGIILRAGLSLSMLFGVSFQTNQVSAAEQLEETNQENTSTKTRSEDEVLENVKEQETNSENVKEQELGDSLESDSENHEDAVPHPKEKLEESEGSENIHNDKSSTDKENEDSNIPDDSQSEEEILEDELDAVVDEEDTNFSETEEKSTEDKAVEKEVNEQVKEDETIESNDEEQNEDDAPIKEPMTMSASSGNSNDTVQVDRLHGQNRFKNAVEISKKGWATAPKVFLANGYKYTDSLTGSPLAALNNAPILLTRENYLPDETLAELKRLKAKEIVILGGELSVPKHIADTLKQNGFTVVRIGGNNRYTQAELVANEIMKVEGKNRDAFLASGEVFSDALSIATIASGKRLPIYLTRGNRLEQSVLNAIPFVNSWTIIGGELSVNQSVENEMKSAGAKVRRIDGRDRYEVNRNVLNFYGVPEEHLYVTSGEHYSDTLPASVLASKEKSGILLLRNNRKNTNDKQKIFSQNKHNIRNFTFIGGPLTLSEQTKNDFKTLVNTVDDELLAFIQQQFSEYTFSQYNIRLNEALNMQMLVNPQTDKRYTAFISKDFIDNRTNTVTADILNVRSGAGANHHIIAQLKKGNKVKVLNETGNWYQIDLNQTWLNANQNDVAYYLNPNNFILSERQKFQFLDLSKTSSATAEELNKFLNGKGILHGMGQTFIDAGKKHGINEIYLLSHALLETGHGTSQLATGIKVNGNTVYNMFGIGAIDSNPIGGGSQHAYKEGWFTPEEAIIGGAAFIGNDYVKAGQNTLYKMRWNPKTMDDRGYADHQYATDIGWAYKQVNTIYNLYQSIGIGLKHVDIPVYLA
jgi:beta-N-acetylglucosaminidase/putative cell wall-binding protein